MQSESPVSVIKAPPPGWRPSAVWPNLVVVFGCALLAGPTMADVARDTWSSEQGGHGPIVLATGIWALWRELKTAHVDLRPGKLSLGLPLLLLCISVFVVAR